jgi:predicted nuclease of restriction endonuclease-like (RecB) superfamily
MIKKKTITPPYSLFLEQLKKRVQQAQLKASLAVNSELIQLYWDIGKSIVEKQKQEGWGASIVEKLGKDLQNAFPGMQGFSRANVFKMRSFYLAYAKVSQAVRQINTLPVVNIPWGHNILYQKKINFIRALCASLHQVSHLDPTSSN